MYFFFFSPPSPRQLKAFQAGEEREAVAGEFGSHPLYKNLGYYSLIGLLRLHCQLGDYNTAMESVANVQLSKKASWGHTHYTHIAMVTIDGEHQCNLLNACTV